jgi:hypothetical protein
LRRHAGEIGQVNDINLALTIRRISRNEGSEAGRLNEDLPNTAGEVVKMEGKPDSLNKATTKHEGETMDSNGGKENGGESAPRRTDPVRISINPDDLLGERGIWLLRTELLMVIEDELEIVATEEEKAEWMARQQAVEQHYARDRESVVSDYTDLVRETCQQRGITAPLEITTTDGIGQHAVGVTSLSKRNSTTTPAAACGRNSSPTSTDSAAGNHEPTRSAGAVYRVGARRCRCIGRWRAHPWRRATNPWG